ncbi:uncharacterized protein LOC133201468 [Saccostrea echinata]|uniref:uncharacterized protein LOC133201468 n=1 Tax=Saccostrea echinata TaxID=191078 RepID=UPI002A819AA7|nr:uncharacterized protein LOC133201468 [Saccostrea echinata]
MAKKIRKTKRKTKKSEFNTLNEKKAKNEGKVRTKSTTKSLTFFDFGGQCAYYACHQIYLTRRAFYIVVLDASKPFDQVVEKEVCDQADSVFADWTYIGYFLFWLKSIHTYCWHNTKDKGAEVIIVATHWDKSIHKRKDDFLEALHKALPADCHLGQYIRRDRFFCTRFPLEPLTDLERVLAETAADKTWEENIPHEWMFLNDEILSTKADQRILSLNHVLQKMPADKYSIQEKANDMLRYYHDTGKILYFNEAGLEEFVVIDVQWFIDAFKTIITDKMHVSGIDASGNDWQEYYSTGYLKEFLLLAIWRRKDEDLLKSLKEENISKECELVEDAHFFTYHKRTLLMYMQRLGLISIGEVSHYIPCINKKSFGKEQKGIIQTSSSRSSIFVFLFEFLPYFLFYRLVVKLIGIKDWRVLKSSNISCLYKNAALFTYQNHNVAVAVTQTTIQLQIFHPEPGFEMLKDVTLSVRQHIEKIMEDITRTFHQRLRYRMGYTCYKEKEQILGIEITHSFIDEKELPIGKEVTCPQHQVEKRHHINPDYLSAYWR